MWKLYFFLDIFLAILNFILALTPHQVRWLGYANFLMVPLLLWAARIAWRRWHESEYQPD